MITASVVLYKTSQEQTDTIVHSVIKSNCIDRLYIIDNSPTDVLSGVKELSPIIEYIKNRNTGYGASHNIALVKAIESNSDYHVVLNPDIVFEPHVILKIKEYMDAEVEAVYLLPKVIYPDGRIQYLCKLLPTPYNLLFRRFLPSNIFVNKINDHYILKKTSYDKIMNPPCLSGCFMFLRLSTLIKHNIFFDERFFMYCEDFDIIRRLHRIGKTVYYPEVSIIHNHQKASYKSIKMLGIHMQSAVKYFNKYGWFFDKERKVMNDKILEEIDK